MRALLALLVLLALVAMGLLVLDDRLADRAEAELSSRVSTAIDADAQVSLPDRPLLWHIADATIPRVEVRADDVPLGEDGDATVHAFTARLDDVRVRLTDLGGDDLPPARRADFTAELSPESARELANLPPIVREVTFLEDGHGGTDGAVAEIDIAGLLQLRAELVAEGGQLVILPGLDELVVPLELLPIDIDTDALTRIPIDLRDEVGGPHVETVAVDDGMLVLSGRLAELEAAFAE